MDAKRFDTWTRTRASTNRRSFLGWSLSAGITSALGRGLPASAQFGSGGGGNGSCTYSISLTSSLTAGQTASGTLVLDIGPNGAIDTGSLTLTGQAPASVVGQATGRAIDLLISLADGTILSLTGVASASVATCASPIAGSLANPDTGQLGVWEAKSGSAGQSAAPATTSGQTTANPPPSGGTCPAPSFPCGPNCCPSGATCTDANQGICVCPNGTTQCGLSCAPNCPNSQTLDLDTCTCVSTCVPDQGSCTSDAECCVGFCGRDTGTCQTCPFLACEGFGCVDPSIDPQNCGGCGIVCSGTTASCTDGVCACQPDGEPCTKHFECCTDTCPPTGICGCTPVGTACFLSGDCCGFNDVLCLDGFCKWANPMVGHACGSAIECISGQCVDGVCK